MSLPTIKDVKKLEIPIFGTDGGNLMAIEKVGFDIKRCFIVKDLPRGHMERGNHAHKKTSQLLILVSGRSSVVCDDGTDTLMIDLKKIGDAVFVPAGLWDSQIYKTKNAILLVVSSEEYNERSDYIDDYDEFLEYRQTLEGSIE